jgi:PAS domain S-box-containing protein
MFGQKLEARTSWLIVVLLSVGPLIWMAVYAAARTMGVRGISDAAILSSAVLVGYEAFICLLFFPVTWVRGASRRRGIALMRFVLLDLPDGVVVADTSGKILMANKAAQRVADWEQAGVSPEVWSSVFGLLVPGTEELLPVDQFPLMGAIHGNEVEQAELFVRNPKAPKGAWLSINGSPLTDSHGRLLGGVVAIRDVTAQKAAAELSERLSNAVEQTADAVFITDRSGRIQYINPAFEQSTGYSSTEVIGQTPRILKSGEQSAEYYVVLWSTIQAGLPFKGTVVNRKKNGDTFCAEQTITPMRDRTTGHITHFVSVSRDMTDRMKIREQELEMRVAAAVQRRLFPQVLPHIPGFDMACMAAPALATGGDLYDFFCLPDGRLCFVIADVSGHGLGAALIMAETRAYLRSLARASARLEDIVSEINGFLSNDMEESHYVTMIVAMLDPTSGLVTWANMGHPAGYVLDSSGAIKCVMGSVGKPLGLFATVGPTQGQPFTLVQGDSLVLFTDGITETTSPAGMEFGSESIIEAVKLHRDKPAKEIVNAVVRAFGVFGQGQLQRDDRTLIVLRRVLCDAMPLQITDTNANVGH